MGKKKIYKNRIKKILEEQGKDVKKTVDEWSIKLNMPKKQIRDYVFNKDEPGVTFMFFMAAILKASIEDLWKK